MNTIQLPNLNLPNLSISSFLLNLGLGIALSALLSWHYSKRSGQKVLRRDLGLVLPAICLTTLLVISVVKSSLALSLGLVGALSIVRFRTPIKEPEELAYIFLAIALGLALGADQREPASIGIFVVLSVISLIDRFNKNQVDSPGNLLLSLEILQTHDKNNLIAEVMELFAKSSPEINLRRVDLDKESLNLVCLVGNLNSQKLSDLSKSFLEKYPDGKFTMIDDHAFPNE